MRRRGALVFALVLVGGPSCGGDDSSSTSDTTHTVLADFNFDEFDASYRGFFPLTVRAHPGDTIDFKQAWTGEPHTVTMGTAVEALGRAMAPYLTGDRPVPDPEPTVVTNASSGIPPFFAEGTDLVQGVAQPCYLDQGMPPPSGACPKVRQPEFNGRQSFYNSGFIPYKGNNGNRFRIRLAGDTSPGTYYYFCVIHGAGMGGYLQVVPKDVAVPSRGDVSRQARDELAKPTEQLRRAHREAASGKGPLTGGDIVVGARSPATSFPTALVNEYFPSTFRTRVGRKVSWMMDGHMVAFQVPRYGSQVIIEQDGTVRLNPNAYNVVGLSEPPPRRDGSSGLVTFDVGNYDGSHFISSGPIKGLTRFSITFTKPGTYKYACLVHPGMIGTVVVSG